MLDSMKDSYWSLAVAQRSISSDLSVLLQQSVAKLPTAYLNSHTENIASVHLPHMTLVRDHDAVEVTSGLGGGAQVLRNAADKWNQTLAQMVNVASMQARYMALEEAILKTNRRVNALEYVIIPSLEENIHYILEVLEEEEREGFFKMKMISNKKAKEAEDAGIKIDEIDESRKLGIVIDIGETEAKNFDDDLF